MWTTLIPFAYFIGPCCQSLVDTHRGSVPHVLYTLIVFVFPAWNHVFTVLYFKDFHGEASCPAPEIIKAILPPVLS